MQDMHYDTIIIGAGITGCAAARSLCRFKLNILILEAEDDISSGATKANSGIVHAGYDCHPGTLKAKLNVAGAAMFPKIAEELRFPFKVNGSLVLCFDKNEHENLVELYNRGVTNGVPDLHLLTADEAYKIEPALADGLYSALWAKTAAIVSPYEAAIAMAENAASNGVEFLFNAGVTNITADNNFTVTSKAGVFTAETVINAAGVCSDIINNHISEKKEKLQPQRGEYFLLDNAYGGYIKNTLFPLPGPLGKGVLVAPTADGNIIVGPNAEDINDGFDTQTTAAGLAEVSGKANMCVKGLPLNGSITNFAGIRAKHGSKDFIINEPVPGFFNALGIDSPGLSAAPAIGEILCGMVTEKLKPKENTNYNPIRGEAMRFSELPFEKQAALIKENPQYGNVVCRCETVTEAEVVSAIRRPLGARTLSALKRRTRCQMGRCQGGFCSLKLGEILSRELGKAEETVWT